MLIFGRHIYFLFAARFLGGFVMGGAAMCVSLFVAEIANNEWVRQYFCLLRQYFVVFRELTTRANAKISYFPSTNYKEFEASSERSISFCETSAFCWHTLLAPTSITFIAQWCSLGYQYYFTQHFSSCHLHHNIYSRSTKTRQVMNHKRK